MGAEAASASSNDVALHLDRHIDMLSRCLARAHGCNITLILRSASSAPAKALISMQKQLASGGLRAQAVLARLEPEEELRQLFACLSALAPGEPASSLIRIARNPRLHEANEQASYGDAFGWLGDAMRRDVERRNTLSVFYEDAPDQGRLARQAFAALWTLSAPVPEPRLRGETMPRLAGEYAPPHKSAGSPSPGFLSSRGWALVRH